MASISPSRNNVLPPQRWVVFIRPLLGGFDRPLTASGGALGTQLSPGAVDIEGDGTADINFVSFGVDSGFLDSLTPFGLTGDSGNSGSAWVRSISTDVATDGAGGNEIIAAFRGVVTGSADNWSKVHLSSGDGWVQWSIGATRDIVTPLRFVREGLGEDLSAVQAAAVPEPASAGLVFSVCALAFAGFRRFGKK